MRYRAARRRPPAPGGAPPPDGLRVLGAGGPIGSATNFEASTPASVEPVRARVQTTGPKADGFIFNVQINQTAPDGKYGLTSRTLSKPIPLHDLGVPHQR